MFSSRSLLVSSAKVTLAHFVNDAVADSLMSCYYRPNNEGHHKRVGFDGDILMDLVFVSHGGCRAAGAVRSGGGRGPWAGPDGVFGADDNASRGLGT